MTFEELVSRANADTRKPPTRRGHAEEDLQLACLRWWGCQWAHRTINGQAIGDLLHHSPNGGRRDAREAARFKRMGTRPGFPDLLLAIPSSRHPYLAVELKTTSRGSRQSDCQREYQRKIEAAGGLYVIVRTLAEFEKTIDAYLADTAVCRAVANK